MEEEKLEEARRTFEDDCEKFEKYLEEVERKAIEAQEMSEQTSKQKSVKMNEIADLTENIHDIENDIQKVEDKLSLF
jgi:polyhydroxyalkanoate synthesis regulator phasin